MLASLLIGLSRGSALAQNAEHSVAVGAIRWDAWHGELSDIGRAVQNSLAPKHWQWRLPFFAQLTPEGDVRIAGDSDEVMTREISCAQAAGVDYWAFCAYGEQSPMSLGLKRYLKNPDRKKVRFCMIGDASHWKPSTFTSEAERFGELMAQPNYQRVLNGRPLFYILNLSMESSEAAWADAGGFRKAVEALRAAARSRGSAEPYCVAMIPWPDRAKAFAEASGCDAISAYAVQGGGKGVPYAELTNYVEDFWKRSAATGAQVIPLAMSGWDRRPRVEHPVFWEQNHSWNAEIERFYQSPKPEEIAGHVRHAVTWTRNHWSNAKAQSVIIYAWNEHDEGGWLCPTLGEGDARIRALGSALTHP